jgi:hypothetical protein
MSQVDLNDKVAPLKGKPPESMQFAGALIMRLLRWPLVAVLSTAVLFIIVYLEQHSDFGIMSLVFVISCLIYIGLAIIFAAGFLIHLLRRRFFLAMSALLAFSITALVMANAQAITQHTFQLIDSVRFSVTQTHYLKIVANQKDQIQRFSWGSGGFLATNFFYTLVYRPDGPPSSTVSATHNGCTITVSELQKNFYIESEICQ